jgi:hypothetical protein
MRLPKIIETALQDTGLPFEVVRGSRHHHIRVAGRLVGILPTHGSAEASPRALRNTVAQIRRAARGVTP